MDHQLDATGEFEPDNFEEIAGRSRADAEHLRRVGIGVKVDDCQCMVDCMSNSSLVEAVLERRSMEFHIALYRNTN
ncbi:hypothetical protein BH23ACT12_BH23ACT12_16660 [soil metagenome]